jgi:hypothetical protein
MKRNLSLILALSALIITAGCKKNLNSTGSVNLAKGAKAGFVTNAGWQMPSITGRLVRYDIGSGNNSDCIIAYDVLHGGVSMTQFTNGSSTTVYPQTNGFVTDVPGVTIAVNNWWSDITDNYNEVGGVHITAYDAGGTGHEDHILLYIPGRGLACLMHYNLATSNWHVDWPSGMTSATVTGTGIGGYDLKGFYDKVISYDYGSGTKKELMLYRPGNGFVWVIQNIGTASSPNWTPRVQSSGGIGGYDLKGLNDQLVTIGGPIHDYMSVAATRPGLGFVWLLEHPANSVNWSPLVSNTSGLPGFSFANVQDRMVSINNQLLSPASSVPEDDGDFLCYRPAAGIGTTVVYQWTPNLGTGPNGLSSFHYTFNGLNAGSLLTSGGDHVLSFTGYGGPFNSSLLFYTPGASVQSQLYYLSSPGTNVYNEVY